VVVAGKDRHRYHEVAGKRQEYFDAPDNASTADCSASSKPHNRQNYNRGVKATAVDAATAVSETHAARRGHS
jgi:hypothetical protein